VTSNSARQSRASSAAGTAHLDLGTLTLVAGISCGLYVAIALVSPRFQFRAPFAERPIPLVLGLFAGAFLLYLYAIRLAVRIPAERRLATVIFWFALAYRLALLPSTPIQEIDIYRYLWDGVTVQAGVSPYRYSPDQIRRATEDQPLPEDLARLVRLRDSTPPLQTVLRRVHHGELPTAYPPVSQVIFAAAAWTTPLTASVQTRLVVLKVWLVALDLTTFFLVLRILALTGRHVGLSVIYAWCPLLLKEVANSGHLDAIAVFLTTLAVYLTTRASCAARGQGRGAAVLPLLAIIVLALAVGAKLYPIVLAPLLAVAVVQRLGWRWAVGGVTLFVVITAAALWPMLAPRGPGSEVVSVQPAQSTESGLAENDTRPRAARPLDPTLGLKMFLRRWEMNDFLFLLLLENFEHDDPAFATSPPQTPWFVATPAALRKALNEWVRARVPVADNWEAAFWLARSITGVCFLGVVGWYAGRSTRNAALEVWLEGVFLTLAWFWLLSPTQNSWYWTWVLPFLPFARSRVWLAMSGLVLLYYLRFWLIYHFPKDCVLGTPYHGQAFFDLVVSWFEYAPWYLCLVASYVWRRRGGATPTRVS
jgi:hypothetical protein